MTLKELISRLAYGELSNLSWSYNGTIKEDKIVPLVQFINETLNKLYSKFYCKQDSILLEPVDGKTEYEISKEHLMDSTLTPTYDKYLFKPGDKPFNDDILRILRVITSTGMKLPINDPLEKYSVYTPLYNKLQCPKLEPNWELEIVYAAKHPELIYDENSDPEIELPDFLIPALCAYVAYMIHSNMNTEVAVANAQKYLSLYNSILAEAVESDIVSNPKETDKFKFLIRGWI